jgi:hypothetical protein
MRLEIIILGITAFFAFNAYHDGKYTKMLYTYKKYYKIGMYALFGLGIYAMLKRDPNQGKNLIYYANNLVKTFPVDRSSIDMLSPILDFTGANENSEQGFMENFNGIDTSFFNNANNKMMNSGKNATRRSVSETKKKYVASNQNWKCGHCKNQLDHTFEIDHKVRLEYGGGNNVENLIALCRNCHGIKTASENM